MPRRAIVLLDANALFLPFRSGLPLTDEIERLCPGAAVRVPSPVLRELDGLVDRGIRGAALARDLARSFAGLAATGRGDAAVVRAAVATGGCVLTADRVLARRLLDRGVSVLVPRDRSRLELRRGRLPAPAPKHAPAGRARRRERDSGRS